jgi:hypothetical protein
VLVAVLSREGTAGEGNGQRHCGGCQVSAVHTMPRFGRSFGSDSSRMTGIAMVNEAETGGIGQECRPNRSDRTTNSAKMTARHLRLRRLAPAPFGTCPVWTLPRELNQHVRQWQFALPDDRGGALAAHVEGAAPSNELERLESIRESLAAQR